jgi:thiamine kinase-like enzyme
MYLNQSEVIFAPTLLVLEFNSRCNDFFFFFSQCFRYWLRAAKSLASPEEAKAFCLDTMEEDISILEEKLSQAHRHIVFCHNDLQYGNIMIDEKTNSITIIVSTSLCWLSKLRLL